MPEKLNPEFWKHLDKLVAESEVVIDSPKGTAHTEFEDTIYPLDYGYLAGTSSADGAGMDVWLGSSGDRQVDAILCTVDLFKRDSEVKILLGCTEDEMRAIIGFLNDGDMRCLLIRRGE